MCNHISNMDGRHCQVCNNEYDEDKSFHNNTSVHRFNYMLYEHKHEKKDLVYHDNVEVNIRAVQINGFTNHYTVYPDKGKHVIKITPKDLRLQGNTLDFLCTVENKRQAGNVILISAVLLHPYELWSLRDPQKLGYKLPELKPGGPPRNLMVSFCSQKPVVGSYKIPLSFNFQTVGKKVDTFTIIRVFTVHVEEIIAEEEETGKSPFTNNDWPEYIEVHPTTQRQRNICIFPIPSDMLICLKIGLKGIGNLPLEVHEQLKSIKAMMDPGYVTAKNYRMFWHIVLWLEEVAQMLMLKRYNMQKVTMELEGDMLSLEVPGLAEKRPSVIVGDMIDIRVHGGHKAYQGVIKKVEDKTVQIAYVHEKLCKDIRKNPKIELDVRFVLNRLPLERMHQGVNETVSNRVVESLFPSPDMSRRIHHATREIRETEFFNRNIIHNTEQKTAVLNILNHTSMDAPYIVFGPPGTGKTVTIVEAILQIKQKTSKRILVCAPANAACGMLTEKLMEHCTKNELIRIMSENVDRQNLNSAILEYTNFQKGTFPKPSPHELSNYRIVVTTLILIGRYSRKYHPDVVFIDEAAQPCEPAACCALGMIEKGKQIILAGDPRQLGPTISSKVSGKYGLGKSLLERMMELELYTSKDQNFITMLKLNFRSHPTILTIPNDLFYDNKLTAVSERARTDPVARVFVYTKIQGLRKKKDKAQRGQAVEFCSIISQESREGRSPSYFNTKEMQMVLKYVEALTKLNFDDKAERVLPEQIGVVTPYIRQVYKIRETLRHNGFEGVEVGTTETFQGREKRIIIISTVRAKHDLLAYDKKYNLGFVRNEKRFNVAVTRAKSKVIVIGCGHVLDTDDKWRRYISYCEELGAFCGAPYAKRTPEVKEEIVRRLDRVKFVDSQYNH